MAINFSNGNLSGNSYSTFGIEKFNGVDYTTTPTSVDESRAIDLSNYTPSGNGLEKRYGYDTISVLTERLGNIDQSVEKARLLNVWEFGGKYLCYADISPVNDNKVLFVCDSLETNTEITIDDVLLRTMCEDDYSFAVEFDNRLFVLCANKYVMIYIDDSAKFHCVDVSSVAYTPTILSGLGHKDSPIVPQYIEDFNMLTNYAYLSIAIDMSAPRVYELNTISQKIMTVYVKTFDGEIEEINKEDTYELTLKGTINIDVTFDITRDEDDYITSITILPDTTAEATEVVINDFMIYVDGQSYDTIEEMRFGIAYGSYGSKDRLFLAGNPNYPHVDFHSAEASFATEEWMDYTYFPDTSYQAFGTSDTAIVGYGILSNGSMAIFKESKPNTNNLYFRDAIITTTTEEYSIVDSISGEIIKYSYPSAVENFPIKNAGLSLEIDKKTKIVQYDNKLIFSTRTGVYYVSIDVSTSSQTYSANELSYFIRGNLSDNLSVSDMIVYKNLLFVLKGSKNGKKRVYVADSNRYSYVSEKLQYEWWIMDGICADKFYIINDELHFSDENGVYKFIPNQYYDNIYRKVTDIKINDTTLSSEVFIDNERDRIIINSNSFIFDEIKDFTDKKEGYQSIVDTTEFTFGSDYMFHIENKFEIIDLDLSVADSLNGKLKIEIPYGSDTYLFYNIIEKNIRVYANEYMFMDCTIEHLYENDKQYVVLIPSNLLRSDITCDKVSFYIESNNDEPLKIKEVYTEHNGFTVPLSYCKYAESTWYYVGFDGSMFVEMSSDIVFNIFELSYYGSRVFINDEQETISHIVVRKIKPVRAYWNSKYNPLGKIDYLKTASSIHFVPMADKGGFTNIGYRTLKRNVAYQSNELHALDFNEVSFNDFTFTQEEFGRTYSAKKKIKNFSFIQLQIYSNEPRNSTIASLVFRFKYTKNNKGVK